MKMMNMTNLLAFGKDEHIDFLILLVVESLFLKKLSIGEVVTVTVAIPLPDMQSRSGQSDGWLVNQWQSPLQF